MARLKAGEIAHWREERASDLRVLSDSPLMAQALSRACSGEGGQLLASRLKVLLRSKPYSAASLALPDGRLVASAGDHSEILPGTLKKYAALAAKAGEVVVGDLEYCETHAKAHLLLAAPMRGGNGAVLVARAEPEEYLYPLIQDWPGPSDTAETLLVERRGERVVYLNELRHRKGTALKLDLPLTETLPAARAVTGRAGFYEGVDYRGKPVYSFSAAVPGSQWFIVAKLDKGEVEEKAALRLRLALGLAFTLLLGAALAAYWYFSRQQRQAEETEHRYLSALTDSGDALVIFDIATREMLDCGGAAEKMYGYGPEEFRRLRADDLVPPGGRAALPERFALIKKEGRRLYATEHLRKDGSVFPVEISARAITADGRDCLHGVIRDISERRRMELERERLSSELFRKNRELEEFLYVTTHDLRSPLVNIQGFSQTLLDYAEGLYRHVEACPRADTGVRELVFKKIPAALGFMTASAAKMDRLIGALLRLSRLGRSAVCAEPLDMNAMLDQIFSYFSFQAQKDGAEMKRGDLPPCLGDKDTLNQLFSNLVENALKYRSPDRAPRVEVRGREAGGRCVYEVEDNGVGLEASQYEKVWKVFYRAAPSGQPGEGLGLALVKAVAEKNGGSVEVRSEPGKGSVFSVELPAVRA